MIRSPAVSFLCGSGAGTRLFGRGTGCLRGHSRFSNGFSSPRTGAELSASFDAFGPAITAIWVCILTLSRFSLTAPRSGPKCIFTTSRYSTQQAAMALF
jgi:hypothetical protein